MIHQVDPDLAQPLAVAATPQQFYAQQNSAPVEGGLPYAGYVDYFGFDERDKHFLPDGTQWIEFKKLDEGSRAKFLKATRSDLRMDQKSGEARMTLDQSGERKHLLLQSCTNWYMLRRVPNREGGISYVEVPFSNNGSEGCEFGKWIDKCNPAVLAGLEKAIRRANPWMLNDMSLEQIDKEINDLTELRARVAENEAREKNS